MQSNDEVKQKFDMLVDNLRRVYGLSFSDIMELSSKTIKVKDEKITLPLEILKNRNLGALESITIYLKDEKNLKFSEIAKALERDDRTIWATYHKAKEKLKNGKK